MFGFAEELKIAISLFDEVIGKFMKGGRYVHRFAFDKRVTVDKDISDALVDFVRSRTIKHKNGNLVETSKTMCDKISDFCHNDTSFA